MLIPLTRFNEDFIKSLKTTEFKLIRGLLLAEKEYYEIYFKALSNISKCYQDLRKGLQNGKSLETKENLSKIMVKKREKWEKYVKLCSSVIPGFKEQYFQGDSPEEICKKVLITPKRVLTLDPYQHITRKAYPRTRIHRQNRK